MIKIFNFDNVEFNIQNMPNPILMNSLDWGRNGDQDSSSMHSISSYLAMFAPALPKYFIENLTKEGDLIYDPFSGRGTTALKSREMKRKFIGSDLNPYALVLSRAKTSKVKKEEIVKLVKKMEIKFCQWIKSKKNANKYRLMQYKELNYFYSPKILKQLIFLREEYGEKWRSFNNVENTLFGIILGLMHGPMRKDNTSIYFSLGMPNTISMSPNYVKNYSLKNNLKKPKANIFNLIRKRVEKKYDKILSRKFDGKIWEINALKNNEKIIDNSVNLLITSPPYLSIVDYIKSNWLKIWLLGYDRKNLKEIKLSDKFKYDEYINFISSFLINVYPKIKKDGHVALIVGDVYNKKIIEEIWEIIKNKVKFKLVNIYWDESYLQNKKVTNMLNNRRGEATKIEKVLLLKK